MISAQHGYFLAIQNRKLSGERGYGFFCSADVVRREVKSASYDKHRVFLPFYDIVFRR